MSKKNLAIILLIALLILSVGYICISKYSSWKKQKDSELYQEGVLFGYQYVIMQMWNMVSDCQEVPLVVNNQTITVVGKNCLGAE